MPFYCCFGRFEGMKRSCKLRLAQRKQRETRRCTSDLAYKFNRPQQARGQQSSQMRTTSGGNSAGARLASLMEDIPQELLPLELQQQQALLFQQLQEYSSEQQHQSEVFSGMQQDQEQQWYHQVQQHSMPLPQLTSHHSLVSAATGFAAGLAPVAEERAAQAAFQSQSMPLPALRMDSITSTSAAAAAATGGAMSFTAGAPSSGLLVRHSSNLSYLSNAAAAMPAASFGAAATPGAAAVSCGSQARVLAERQLQQLQVQQQMQQLKALQLQMQAMVSSWPAAAEALDANHARQAMERQQQSLSQAAGCMSGPLPALQHCMQGQAAPVSGPLPSLSGQGLGLSGPLPALSGLSAPPNSSCHVSAPLPAVPLAAADAASGQLSTAGCSTASALAGGIEHLLELIDEGDEEEHHNHDQDQALPFTDNDLRSMLEVALESASGPPVLQQPGLQQAQQLQQQQQALQAQQQQQLLQQQLLQELQELRPSACSSQTWQHSSTAAAAAQMQLQLQQQSKQLVVQQQLLLQQQQAAASQNTGPAAAIRAALQQKMQRIQQLQRMVLEQVDAEVGSDNSGSFLNAGVNSNHSSGNWLDVAAAVKPGVGALAPQMLQQQQLQPQLPAALPEQQPADALMVDANILQAQLLQLQQQCASLKEEINRTTKQRSSQDPASVSCC
jgi:hypothetical protein